MSLAMQKKYLGLSVVLFVIASLMVLAMMVSPPQQHGRGMGAALFGAYVMLGWAGTAVNLIIAGIVAWLARRSRSVRGSVDK